VGFHHVANFGLIEARLVPLSCVEHVVRILDLVLVGTPPEQIFMDFLEQGMNYLEPNLYLVIDGDSVLEGHNCTTHHLCNRHEFDPALCGALGIMQQVKLYVVVYLGYLAYIECAFARLVVILNLHPPLERVQRMLTIAGQHDLRRLLHGDAHAAMTVVVIIWLCCHNLV